MPGFNSRPSRCGCNRDYGMYVCLCHGFTDGDVKGAIAQGCRSVAAVYRHLADRPQCGKCVPEVRSLVQSHCAGQCSGLSRHFPQHAVAKADSGE